MSTNVITPETTTIAPTDNVVAEPATIHDYDKAYDAMKPVWADALARSKILLFDVMKAHGITLIRVDFDGEGDSGQIQSITAFRAENQMTEMPDVSITCPDVDLQPVYENCATNPSDKTFAGYQIATTEQTQTVTQYAEDLCYRLLSDRHGSWQDNDGAFGGFVFDVEDGTIILDFNERFTDTTNYQAEW